MLQINIISEFANYLRNIKNRSELTISAYCSDLAQFCAIFHFKYGFGEITRIDIENVYIPRLVAENVCPVSRARKLSSINVFYKWATGHGYVVENPVENVEKPKIPQKSPKIMSPDEVAKVLVYARNSDSIEETLFRDIAVLMLMFYTGVRRAEVVNIKLMDVDLKNSSILIHGKGNKERLVYFNDSTRSVLSEYMQMHRKLFKTAKLSEYLFVSQRAKQLSTKTINDIVNKQLKNAGLKDKGYTAHSTRKAFATAAYESTKDIYAVQSLLGHNSPNTTMRYVKASEEIKKQTAQVVSF